MNTSKSQDSNKGEINYIRLSELSEGDSGIIYAIRGGPVHYRKRLLDLGLTPGTPIKVIREAPLGDPIEIEVKGYSLALRRKDAWHILIRTNNPEPSTS